MGINIGLRFTNATAGTTGYFDNIYFGQPDAPTGLTQLDNLGAEITSMAWTNSTTIVSSFTQSGSVSGSVPADAVKFHLQVTSGSADTPDWTVLFVDHVSDWISEGTTGYQWPELTGTATYWWQVWTEDKYGEVTGSTSTVFGNGSEAKFGYIAPNTEPYGVSGLTQLAGDDDLAPMEWTNSSVIISSFTLDDPDTDDLLKFYLEITSVTTGGDEADWSQTYYASTSEYISEGTTGYQWPALTDRATYWWRMWCEDDGGLVSPSTSVFLSDDSTQTAKLGYLALPNASALEQINNLGAPLTSMQWTTSAVIVSSFTLSSPMPGDLKFYLEITSVTTGGDLADWDQTWYASTSDFIVQGTTGYQWPALTEVATYWWRVWVEDSTGFTSSTSTALGVGGDAKLGFTTVPNQPPNDVSGLTQLDGSGIQLVSMQWSSSTVIISSFTLDDPDDSDLLRFYLEITSVTTGGDTADWSQLFHATTSEYLAEGTTGYQWPALTDDATYWWRVWCEDDDFAVSPSTSVYLSDDSTQPAKIGFMSAPSAPTNLKISSLIDTATIYWQFDDNAANETGLYISSGPDVAMRLSENLGPLSGTGTTYWYEVDLVTNTAYTRYAESVNGIESSWSAVLTSFSASAIPGALTATTSSYSTIELNWSANDNLGTTKYGVSYSTNIEYDTAISTFIDFASGLTDVTTAAYNLTLNDTTYYFRLWAYNEDTVETLYVEHSTTTVPDFPPNAITGLSAESANIITGAVNLSWISPSDPPGNGAADSYIIRYATYSLEDVSGSTETWWNNAVNVSSEPAPGAPTGTEIMGISGLPSGTSVYFYIKSMDASSNESELSDIATWYVQPHLLISEFACGIGVVNDEFVELYNPTDAAIDVTNIGGTSLKLRLRSATGADSLLLDFSGEATTTIASEGFYLIATSTGATYGAPVDATDALGTSGNGSIYLTLGGANTFTEAIDRLSFGTITNDPLVTESPASVLATDQSLERKPGGGQSSTAGNGTDTNKNISDFDLITDPAQINPQNTLSGLEQSTNNIPFGVSALTQLAGDTELVSMAWTNSSVIISSFTLDDPDANEQLKFYLEITSVTTADAADWSNMWHASTSEFIAEGTTGYQWPSLTDEATYWWRVWCEDNDGNPSPSTTTYLADDAALAAKLGYSPSPDAPTGLTQFNDSGGDIVSMQWTTSTVVVSSFTLSSSAPGDLKFYLEITSVTTGGDLADWSQTWHASTSDFIAQGTTEYQWPVLTEEATYWWRVWSGNTAGFTSSTSTALGTGTGGDAKLGFTVAPDSPSGLTQFDDSGTELVSMQWSSSTVIISSFTLSSTVAGNLKFYLEITSVTTGGDLADWSQTWHASTSEYISQGTTEYQWPVLTDDATYWWRVWSENTAGFTSSTSTVLGITGDAKLGRFAVPYIPSGLVQINNLGTEMASMQWSESTTIISSFTISSPDLSESLKFYLEITSVTTGTDEADWSQTWYASTSEFISQGTTGYQWPTLSEQTTYWWRVWSEDVDGWTSSTSTTLNVGGEAKFGFAFNNEPYGVSGLTQLAGVTELIQMEWTASSVIISSFTLDDPDADEQLKFYLHITSVTTGGDAADWSQLFYAATSQYLAEGTTGYQWPALTDKATYWWRVWCEDDEGAVSPSTTTYLADDAALAAKLGYSPPPDAPTGLTQFNDSGGDIVSMQWSTSTVIISSWTQSSSIAGDLKFYLQITSVTTADAADWSNTWYASTSGFIAQGTTEYQWPALTEESTYWWRVWSEDSMGFTSSTSTALGTGGDAKLGFTIIPDAPSGLTQIDGSGTDLVSMQWSSSTVIISSFTQSSSVTGDLKFYLQITSVTTGGDTADWSQTWYASTSDFIAQGTTGYQWPALTDDTTYWWRVWSENTAGFTSSTATVMGAGDILAAKLGYILAPVSATDLKVFELIGATTVNWQFTDNATNETGLYISSGPDVTMRLSENLGPISGTGTTYWYEINLDTNTQYTRYVETVNGIDRIWSTEVTSYTAAAIPGALTATTSSYSSIELVWTANDNPGTTRYGVSYSTNTDYATAVSTFINFTSALTDVTTVAYNLSADTTYYFRLWAYNGDEIETGYVEHSTTTFPAAVSPDDLLINEVAPAGAPYDWVEIYVLTGGNYSEYRFYEGSTLRKTFPVSFNPGTGDYIVVWFSSGSETVDEDDGSGKGANGFWDFYTADAGISAEDEVLSIKRSADTTWLDGVCYSDRDGVTTATFETQYNISRNSGAWTGPLADEVGPSADDATVQAACANIATLSSNKTIGRLSTFDDTDAESDWVVTLSSSPGSVNVDPLGSVASDIVINEVMASAADTDTGQFVELYNKGTTYVDISGWIVRDAAATDVIEDYTGANDWGTAGTVIVPGGYALVMDSEYAGEYNAYLIANAVSANVIMLTVGNTTIGDQLGVSSDRVEIDNNSGYVSTYTWTSSAGSNISWEKIYSTGTDDTSNWASSVDGSGSTPGIPNSVSPDTELPDGISNLTALAGDVEGSLVLGWTAPGDDGTVGGITGGQYEIKYTSVAQITSGNYSSPPDPTYTITISTNYSVPLADHTTYMFNLTPGTSYWFAVKTRDEKTANWSVWTSSADDTAINNFAYCSAQDFTPAQPQGFTSLAGDTQILLSWTANSETDLDYYKIYRDTSDPYDFTDGLSPGTTPYLFTSFTDTGLENDTSHVYKLTVVDNTGHESAASVTISTIPYIAPPFAPTTPVVILLGPTSIQWQFDDNANNETALYISSGADMTMLLSENLAWAPSSETGTTYWWQLDIDTNTQYTVYAGATNTQGPAWTSAVSTYTLAVVPASFSAATNDSSSINLSWNSNTNPGTTRFGLTLATDAGFTTGVSEFVNFDSALTDLTTVAYNLSADTTYYFRLWAYNGDRVQTAYIEYSTTTAPVYTAPGIECTEIMYDPPATSDDAGGEWLEFYNNTSGNIDLTNWILTVGDESETLSQRAGGWGDITAIPPQAFFVISEPGSTANFDTIYGPADAAKYCAVTGSAITLNKTGGELVALRTALVGGTTYQYFTYSINAVDTSVEKTDFSADETLSASWVPSLVSIGTPFSAGQTVIPAEGDPPAAVSDLTALAGADDGEVILYWTSPGDNGTIGSLTGVFEIKYSSSGIITTSNYGAVPAGNVVVISTSALVPLTECTRVMTGLFDDSMYYFALKTLDDASNWSVWTSSADDLTVNTSAYITSPLIRPAAISDLTALASSDDGQIVLQWTAPGDDEMTGNLAGEFKIKYSSVAIITNGNYDTPPESTYELLIATSGVVPLSSCETTVTGLLGNNELYYFAIKARDEVDGNWSVWTSSADDLSVNTSAYMTVQLVPPNNISDLTALTGAGDGEVVLSWTAPGDNLESGNISDGEYWIKYSTNPLGSDDDFTNAATFVQTSTDTTTQAPTSTAVTGLNPGTTYYLALKYRDEVAGNWAFWSTGTVATEDINVLSSATASDAVPSAPSGLTATASSRQIVLSWSAVAVSDLDYYQIYCDSQSPSFAGQFSSATTTNTTITFSELENNVTYYYRITAVDTGDQGNGLYSEALESDYSGDASAMPVIAPPSGLQVNNTGTSVMVLWTKSTDDPGTGDCAGYVLSRSSNNIDEYYIVIAGTDTLPSGTTYYSDTSVLVSLTYWYKLKTRDITGADSYEVGPSTAIPDTVGPSIDIISPDPADTSLGFIGGNIVIIATVTDVSDNAYISGLSTSSVLLKYTGLGGAVYSNTLTMDGSDAGGYFRAAASIPNTAKGTFSYYITATDNNNNTSTTSTHTVTISPETSVVVAYGDTGASITVKDGDDSDGSTGLFIPLGAVDAGVTVTIEQWGYPGAPASKTPPDAFANGPLSSIAEGSTRPVVCYDFNITGSGKFKKPVTVTMRYLDQNNDGEIDDLPGILEKDLGTYWWDNYEWKYSVATVDAAMNTISASVDHFTLFAVFKKGVIPARPTAKEKFLTPATIDGINDRIEFECDSAILGIEIYDVTGKKIRTIDNGSNNWDGTDEDGNIVESGVYIYKVEAANGEDRTGAVVVAK